jgi:hypothetical protein
MIPTSAASCEERKSTEMRFLEKATKGIESLCAHQKGGLLSDSLPSRSEGNRGGGPQSHTLGHNRETIRVKSQYEQIKLRWINWNRNFPLQRDVWRESAVLRWVQQSLLAFRGLGLPLRGPVKIWVLLQLPRGICCHHRVQFLPYIYRPASVSNSNSRLSASSPSDCHCTPSISETGLLHIHFSSLE